MLGADDMKRFLKALQESPSIASACRKAKVSRYFVKKTQANDPEFDRQVTDALTYSQGLAEDALFQRAVTGWEEPVFYRGERVPMRDPDTGEIVKNDDGTVKYWTAKKFDGSLLPFYLSSVDPSLYGRSSRTSDTDKQVLSLSADLDLSALSSDELEMLDALLAKAVRTRD